MSYAQIVPVEESLLRRICGEYLEMPGLRLKREQAERLWGLDAPTCSRVLDVLVSTGFLYRHIDGRYARRSDGAVKAPLFRMAKAALEHGSIARARKT